MTSERRLLIGWLALGLLGCASSAAPPRGVGAVAAADDGSGRGVVEARGADERQLLARVGELVTARRTRVGALWVTAEPEYLAASGRSCRPLSLTAAGSAPRRRLACRDDQAWFFVPEVFVSAPSAPAARQSRSVAAPGPAMAERAAAEPAGEAP